MTQRNKEKKEGRRKYTKKKIKRKRNKWGKQDRCSLKQTGIKISLSKKTKGKE
jgi:hypothetical protein